MRTVQALAAAYDRWIAAARDLLLVLVQLPAVRQGDAAACGALLPQLFTTFDRYTGGLVATPDGTVVCSSRPLPFPGSLTVADRPYFQHTLQTLRFTVGEYRIGQISQQPILPLALPVLDAAQGTVQAVVTVGLGLGWLHATLQTQDLPPGSTVTLMDRQGTVLAREPELASWLGQSVPEGPLRIALLAAKGPGSVEAAGVDGVRRFYAFVPLGAHRDRPDGYLSVGIPRAIIATPAEQTFRWQLLLLGIAAVGAFGTAWMTAERLVRRPTQALVRAAEQLGVGDLEVRIGPPYPAGELGQLARAFDDMTTALAYASVMQRQAQEALARQAQELARSNAELEQFAYIASHDLQEPLRKVTNYTQLFVKRCTGRLDVAAEKYIAYIQDGTTRMQQLIQDLLTYSRVSRGEVHLEEVNMDELLHKTLATLEVSLAETGAEVTAEALPTIQANPTQMGQLMQNLLGNALKFRSQAPPRIHVAAASTPTEWVFAVRDNGIGLEPQYAERIFLMFQRLHTRAAYPGTGIGLAICQRIVQRHGGRIWVESQLGDGATFYVALPRQPHPTRSTARIAL
jgi:signal transduction histidine kinase